MEDKFFTSYKVGSLVLCKLKDADQARICKVLEVVNEELMRVLIISQNVEGTCRKFNNNWVLK